MTQPGSPEAIGQSSRLAPSRRALQGLRGVSKPRAIFEAHASGEEHGDGHLYNHAKELRLISRSEMATF